MPAKSPPNAEPPGSAPADPGVDSQDSELAAAGRELAEDLGRSGTDEFSSPAGRRAAERTARRRQRAQESDAPARSARRSTQSARAPIPAWASTLRDAVPAPVIAVVAGGVLGVILGALSVGGWLIGLLVAAVTVILLGALGSPSRSTRSGTK